MTDPLLTSTVSRPLDGCDAVDLVDRLLQFNDDRSEPRLAETLLLSADSEVGFFDMGSSSNMEFSSSSR